MTWDKQAFEREFQKIRLAQSADHPIIPFVPEMYLAEPDKLFAFIDRQVEEAYRKGKEDARVEEIFK